MKKLIDKVGNRIRFIVGTVLLVGASYCSLTDNSSLLSDNSRLNKQEILNLRTNNFLYESRERYSQYGMDCTGDMRGIYKHRAVWKYGLNLKDSDDDGIFDTAEDIHLDLEDEFGDIRGNSSGLRYR
mgnify:CR=1 FL=1|jgi:hypothetical protein